MKTPMAPVAAALACALAAAPSTAEAKKPNSVMFGVPQLGWSAFHVEYERKLVRKISLGGFGTIGSYDPFVLKMLPNQEEGWAGLNHRMLGVRANLYPLGGFKRGLILGTTARFGRFIGTGEFVGQSDDIEFKVASKLVGVHAGFRFRFKMGLAFSAIGGIGYHKFGDLEVTLGDLGGSEDVFGGVPPVMTYGTINAGWNF